MATLARHFFSAIQIVLDVLLSNCSCCSLFESGVGTAIAPQPQRGRFALRAKAPLAGVPKGTEPKNYIAPPLPPHADLQLKQAKPRSVIPPCNFAF
ncbi:hypothetical protein DV706_08260 [Natronorubrum bangense]|uniref:Uncharacterized protein n=1 Tax=Natronorubrum bangense TaxID=61858 RepID=A0A4D6HKL2_9EURY|nr:hypothetical protein DV706_08260 [Natronorubrum bangense]